MKRILIVLSLCFLLLAAGCSLKKDEVVDLTYTSNGGNSGIGTASISYYENGDLKTFTFWVEGKPELKDINNDGNKEIIVPISFAFKGLPRSDQPAWYNIFQFDIPNKKLVLVDGKFPKYYQDVYIPNEKNRLAQYNDQSSAGAKAFQYSINVAEDVIAGKLVMDDAGLQQARENFRNVFILRSDSIIGHWASELGVQWYFNGIDVNLVYPDGVILKLTYANKLEGVDNKMIVVMGKDTLHYVQLLFQFDDTGKRIKTYEIKNGGKTYLEELKYVNGQQNP